MHSLSRLSLALVSHLSVCVAPMGGLNSGERHTGHTITPGTRSVLTKHQRENTRSERQHAGSSRSPWGIRGLRNRSAVSGTVSWSVLVLSSRLQGFFRASSTEEIQEHLKKSTLLVDSLTRPEPPSRFVDRTSDRSGPIRLPGLREARHRTSNEVIFQ